MKINLGSMPYMKAMAIVKWCFEHNIDTGKCIKLATRIADIKPTGEEWSLEVPDEYITFFMLKWDLTVREV